MLKDITIRHAGALVCTAALLATSLTACGSAATSSTSQSEVQSASYTMQVTAVDGTTVTGAVGEIAVHANGGETVDGQTPPEMPTGDADANGQTPPELPANDGNANGGAPADGQTPPELPVGDGNANGGATADGQTPPELPANDGNANGNAGGNGANKGMGGGMGGSAFTAGEETVTFTLTENTVITLELLQGSSEGTADDVTVGAVLDVTVDAADCATAVTVRNLAVGGGFGGSNEVTNGTSVVTLDADTTVNGESYTSDGDDENALRVDGATVTLNGIAVEKAGGESSNTENGDFYGQNAALLALNGATVTVANATVTTNAVNGNGVFSYGEGTTVNISDSTIRTTQNNSGGIQTTGGGTTNATNLDVETSGNSAAAIRSDRGGGTVTVDGGTYVTNGTGSPAIYCTANISAANATLTANASEGVVVEGKNSVSLTDCTLTGNMSNTYQGDADENIHNIMIYQSMSGDAAMGEANFSAVGGSITAQTGDMFYVTNTDCTITLSDVALTLANDTLLRVEGNTSSRGWGTQGANGGDVVLNAESQTLTGNILVDSISSLAMTLTGSAYTGAINPNGAGGTVEVTLDGTSTWTLTADSYITAFTGDTADINADGHHVYVNGEQLL